MARHADSRAQAAAGAGVAKTRRSHRKSRNGCIECKRRHIRCDEGRPTCTNCTIAERLCSFPTPPSAASLGVPSPHPQSHARHSPARSNSSAGSRSLGPDEHPRATPPSLPSFNECFAAAAGTAPSASVASIGASFTPQHLMLLHHVETGMKDDILGVGQTPTLVDMAVRHAVEFPYLIDQLLAFSAMHLAHKIPERAAVYRHQATELQTRGLAYFTKETELLGTDDVNSAGPRFLFATLLSLHTLAETMTYHRAEFDFFLDRFIECMKLHRGILYIVRPQLQMLMQSELEPILALSQIQLPRDPHRGTECEPLMVLVDSARDLPAVAASGCREAARLLQWAFDLSGRLPTPDLPHAVSGFSVMVPPEYLDALRGRWPEALVILAYYAVLLHRTRRYWICGRNGAFMIAAIAQHLGPQWHEQMRWPLEVLEREHD